MIPPTLIYGFKLGENNFQLLSGDVYFINFDGQNKVKLIQHNGIEAINIISQAYIAGSKVLALISFLRSRIHILGVVLCPWQRQHQVATTTAGGCLDKVSVPQVGDRKQKGLFLEKLL